jgi:transposase
MKEDLRRLWNRESKAAAGKHLEAWIQKALSSKVPMLIKMANTLATRKFGLLAYYDHPMCDIGGVYVLRRQSLEIFIVLHQRQLGD